MKFSLFPNHGALNSKPVFEAFAQGVKNLGHTVVFHDLNADCYVIWSVLWQGRMRGNQEIWNFAKKTKKPVIILEVGTLVRGTTWKLGLSHVNALGYNFEKFDIDPVILKAAWNRNLSVRKNKDWEKSKSAVTDNK